MLQRIIPVSGFLFKHPELCYTVWQCYDTPYDNGTFTKSICTWILVQASRLMIHGMTMLWYTVRQRNIHKMAVFDSALKQAAKNTACQMRMSWYPHEQGACNAAFGTRFGYCMATLHGDASWHSYMAKLHGGVTPRRYMATLYGDVTERRYKETVQGDVTWRRYIATLHHVTYMAKLQGS